MPPRYVPGSTSIRYHPNFHSNGSGDSVFALLVLNKNPDWTRVQDAQMNRIPDGSHRVADDSGTECNMKPFPYCSPPHFPVGFTAVVRHTMAPPHPSPVAHLSVRLVQYNKGYSLHLRINRGPVLFVPQPLQHVQVSSISRPARVSNRIILRLSIWYRSTPAVALRLV